MLKKCLISRYDESIKEPPFLTINIDEMVVEKPENDTLGEKFADILYKECFNKGYVFKFYTTISENKDFDYEVVVH